jgi:hypothetical protein
LSPSRLDAMTDDGGGCLERCPTRHFRFRP